MAKTYRVAVIGMVHDHIWGELKRAATLTNIQLVAAADPNQPLLDRVQERASLNGNQVYTDYRLLLQEHGKNLDIVLAYSDNAQHLEIVEACAPLGIHVMMEKPMAATLAQAERMAAIAKQHNIQLLINWPNNWSASVQHAIKLAQEGAIGDLYQVRYRSAHAGPKEIGCDPYFVEWLYDEERNGAGAYMDYCCYGAAFCSLLLGLPERVTGIRAQLTKDYQLPDDNAIVMMEYLSKKAFGLAEGSWALIGADPLKYTPVFYGKTGTIVIPRNSPTLNIYRKGSSENEAEVITPPALPEGHRGALEYFTHCLDNNTPVEGMCSVEVSRNAQEILEAGLRSAESHQAVSLPLA